MRYLFISYIFPGPLGAMASWLASRNENQVIFASTRSRQELPLPNVQRVVVKTYPGKKGFEDPDYFDLWEEAARAGKAARSSLELVKSSGFEPDMIFSASSNGSALGLRQIFPDAFLVNFLEEENFTRSAQAALRRGIQSLQVLQANLAFAFTEKRKSFYPPELWPKIGLAPQAIDSGFFDPAHAQPFHCWKFGAQDRDLLTVFAQGLEEHALFHCWNACLEILEKCPAIRIVLLVNGTYALRRLTRVEIPEKLSTRLFMEAHLRQDNLRDLLASSLLAIFPGEFIPMGLLEAMSCASCPVLGNHRYFLKNGWDCLEMPPITERLMAGTIAQFLAHPEALKEIGLHARRTAVENFGAESVMPRFFSKIEEAYRLWNGGET